MSTFRWGAAGIALSLLIVSCSTDQQPSSTTIAAPPASAAPSAAQDPPPIAAQDALVFTEAGITITPIGAPIAGPALTFTDVQAATLLRQAQGGQGWSGAQLDDRIPTAEDEFPISYLAIAWLVESDSIAAQNARTLMPQIEAIDPATVDSRTVVFPMAVLALLIQDLATPAPGPAGFSRPQASGPVGFAPVAAAATAPSARALDPCASIMNFYEGTIGTVLGMLTGTADYLLPAFTEAVGLAPPYKGIKLPKKDNLGGPWQALGFLIGLAGALSPWTVTIDGDPAMQPGIDWGVEPAPGNEGIARVVVDPGLNLTWPSYVKSCASIFGIDLPDLNPIGALVEWYDVVPAGAVDVLDSEGVVMQTDTGFGATLKYRTPTESAETATGTAVIDVAVFSAKVTRNGNANLRALVQQLLDRYLGSVAGDIINFFAGDLLAQLDAINQPDDVISILHLTHHVPPPPKVSTTDPTSSAPPAPDATGSCVGVDLTSGAQGNMPAGVRLRIEPNGTVIWDFNSVAPINTEGGGLAITIKLAGSMAGTSTRTDNKFQTNMSSDGLVIVATIDGVDTPLDASDLASLATIDGVDGPSDPGLGLPTTETLTCVDGTITVDRTGQVFS